MATLLAEDLLLLLVRRDKVLGLFPRTRWPARDSSHEDGVRRSLTAVLVAVDAATMAIITSIAAGGAISGSS